MTRDLNATLTAGFSRAESRLSERRQLPFAPFSQGGDPAIPVWAQDLHQHLSDGEVAVPLSISGHDVPGRPICRRPIDRGVVCGLIVVPPRSVLPVSDRQLPGLLDTLLPGQQ